MAIVTGFSPLALQNLRSNSLAPLPTTTSTDSVLSNTESGTITPPGDGVTLSTTGQRWAQSVQNAAAGNDDLKRRRCYRFVKQGLAEEGINLTGGSAYMAAGQLARNPQVQELKGVKASELSELPAGAIVVWNKNKKHPHGHISVALGDGREVSDRIRQQIEAYGTSVRVFVPREGATLNASTNAANPDGTRPG